MTLFDCNTDTTCQHRHYFLLISEKENNTDGSCVSVEKQESNA